MLRLTIHLTTNTAPGSGAVLGYLALHSDEPPDVDYRLLLRRVSAVAQGEGFPPYTLEDGAGSDPDYCDTYPEAVDLFLRRAADEVRRLREGRVDVDPRDERVEQAEAIRRRVYGTGDDVAQADHDRAAILAWLETGDRVAEDPLGLLVTEWRQVARETGYDRERTRRRLTEVTHG